MAAPLPPRRHSAVQQGTNNNTTNLYQMIQPNNVNSSSTKQANGDISSMPPPPNPRNRPVPPFPIGVPVLPSNAANIAGQYVYATTQQQYQQLRHTGEIHNSSYDWILEVKICLFLGMIPSPPPRTNQQQQQPRLYPQTHNLAEMARLHRLGRAYSHEGVISDIDIYYPDEDGKKLNN